MQLEHLFFSNVTRYVISYSLDIYFEYLVFY